MDFGGLSRLGRWTLRNGVGSDVVEEDRVNNFDQWMDRVERGDAWDEDAEVVEMTVKRPLGMFVSIRIPYQRWQELRPEAQRRGMTPGDLINAWIEEKLREATALKSSR